MWFGFRRPVMYVPFRFALATPLDPPIEDDPLARGVGQKEQPLTCVWCTHGARGDNRPPRIEPELVKVTEHPPESFAVSNKPGHVSPRRRSWVERGG